MDLQFLLDKQAKIQLDLFNLLMDSPKPISKKDLMKEINLSAFLLNSNLAGLKSALEKSQSEIRLIETEEENQDYYHLIKGNDDNSKFIYFYYLNHSLDYQMLAALFETPPHSVKSFAKKFSVAESALYVHFAHINTFLKNYDIKIKSCQIVGNELKICYFFYHFYLSSLPITQLKEMCKSLENDAFIHELEKKLQYKFPTNDMMKIKLWMLLAERRKLSGDFTKTKNLEIIMEDLVDDSLYQLVTEVYENIKGAYSEDKNQFTPFFVYVFLTSMYILPKECFPEYDEVWKTNIVEIIEMNNFAVSFVERYFLVDFYAMDEENLEQLKYLLTQVHSQIFYFNSYYSDNALDQKFVNNYITTYVPNRISNGVDQMILELEKYLDRSLYPQTKFNLQYVYNYFSKLLAFYSQQKIEIGIYSYVSSLQTEILTTHINEMFKSKYNIHCSIAKVKEHYDVLISDTTYFLKEFDYDTFYILGGLTRSIDLDNILNILDETYKRKNLR